MLFLFNFIDKLQVGYIKTDDGTFFIEPAEHYGPNELGHHLHIIHMSDDPIMNENVDDVIVKKKENQCYATSASDDYDDYENSLDENVDASIHSSKIISPYENSGDASVLKKADDAFLFEKPKKLWKKNCGSEKWEDGWSKAFKNYFKKGIKKERNVEQDLWDDKEDKEMKEKSINMHKVSKKKVKNKQTKRKRRSSSYESVHRYLEVLVVADKMFLDFHKDKDYENYILTTMNMVRKYAF